MNIQFFIIVLDGYNDVELTCDHHTLKMEYS